MNHLAVVDDGGDRRWRLPAHARLVVYDAGPEELITVYDCGAAQKPPSAQLRGHLVRIDAEHRLRRRPTGYAATLSERAQLIDQGESHWVVRG